MPPADRRPADRSARPIPVPGRAERVSTPARAAAATVAARGRSAASTGRPTVPPEPRTAAGVPTPPVGARRRPGLRWAIVGLVVLLVAALAWPIGLVVWANKKVQHTAALSGTASTGGTTYLITGSDARGGDGIAVDGTSGARTDTILLLQVPDHGPTALISLPRDTYVQIPGHGSAKLNAAYSWGGAPLLVQTVEQLTGLTVDHYAEIGMGGVKDVVNAVGGVHLCWDANVNDADSGMVWQSGCHDVDGTAALAFSRMRKADPTGDIGRGQRQRQLVSAVMAKINPSSLVWHPDQQVALIDTGTAALTVDKGMNIVDLAHLALAFKAANGPGGITGTPPIKSMDYRPGKVGSTVLLDAAKTTAFWVAIRDGSLPAGQVGGPPKA